jgi:DNA helicase II / ATP-dependent DNA helicase PcrA
MRSRFLDEIPDELLDEPRPTFFRASSLSSSFSSGASVGRGSSARARRGERRDAAASWSLPSAEEREQAEPASQFRLGEDVVHAAFGDGVVTAVEPGGVIVVRFAGDGSERKLMAEYAPVSRR